MTRKHLFRSSLISISLLVIAVCTGCSTTLVEAPTPSEADQAGDPPADSQSSDEPIQETFNDVPSHPGPSDRKTAGGIQFWVQSYGKYSQSDETSKLEVRFCPADGAATASWAMGAAGAIAISSVSGETLPVVSVSQYDIAFPQMSDQLAEQGVAVTTSSCEMPQIWGVYFSEPSGSVDTLLSRMTLTTDQGDIVTFSGAEIPAFQSD